MDEDLIEEGGDALASMDPEALERAVALVRSRGGRNPFTPGSRSWRAYEALRKELAAAGEEPGAEPEPGMGM